MASKTTRTKNALLLINSDAHILRWLDERASDTYPAGHLKAGQQKRCRRLNDGGGLFLLDEQGKAAAWRFEFRKPDLSAGLISLGTFASTPLAKAREEATKKREQQDPAAARKQERVKLQASRESTAMNAARRLEGLAPVDSFEDVARRFHAKKLRDRDWGDKHAAYFIENLERHVFPIIGSLQFEEITKDLCRAVVKPLEGKGETASNMREFMGQVFKHAIDDLDLYHGVNWADQIKGATAKPRNEGYPILDDLEKLRAFVKELRQGHKLNFITRVAVELQMQAFQRPGNTLALKWKDIDWAREAWVLPGQELKLTQAQKDKRPDHLIPLSTQMIDLLMKLKPMTGHLEYAFVLKGTQPMGNKALNGALRKLGFNSGTICAHGFRGTAQTMLCDYHDVDNLQIEVNMAHIVSGPMGDTYNRATFVNKRKHSLQIWANFLDDLEHDRFEQAQVLEFKAAA